MPPLGEQLHWTEYFVAPQAQSSLTEHVPSELTVPPPCMGAHSGGGGLDDVDVVGVGVVEPSLPVPASPPTIWPPHAATVRATTSETSVFRSMPSHSTGKAGPLVPAAWTL